jgi:hypothetical protein
MFTNSGGLKIQAGSGTVALTTTLAKLTNMFNGNSAAAPTQYSPDLDGSIDIVPDKSNDRIRLLANGIYRVEADLSVSGGAAYNVLVQLAIGGVLQPEFSAECTIASGAKLNIGFAGILDLTKRPLTGMTFLTDPRQVAAELWANCSSGTPNLTIEYCSFLATRLG